MSRDRQRLHVERRRNGLVVLPVVAFEVGIVEMLEADGFLPRCCEHSREAIAEALSRWLHEAVTRHYAAFRDLP